MTKNNADLLIDMLLHFPKLDNVFNPHTDYDSQHDASKDAPIIRRNQFKSYINGRVDDAKVVLIAEAPGYKGCKFSGIAMTDKRVLLGKKVSAPFGQHSIIDIEAQRTSAITPGISEFGMGELTSTVLYSFLYENNIDPRTVVTWNAFPFHPHEAGNPMSNRAPKIHEIEGANHIHREFFSVFSGCRVISIGNYASELMDELGIACERVRHPAFGGAKIFTEFLKKAIKSDPRQSFMELSVA